MITGQSCFRKVSSEGRAQFAQMEQTGDCNVFSEHGSQGLRPAWDTQNSIAMI